MERKFEELRKTKEMHDAFLTEKKRKDKQWKLEIIREYDNRPGDRGGIIKVRVTLPKWSGLSLLGRRFQKWLLYQSAAWRRLASILILNLAFEQN